MSTSSPEISQLPENEINRQPGEVIEEIENDLKKTQIQNKLLPEFGSPIRMSERTPDEINTQKRKSKMDQIINSPSNMLKKEFLEYLQKNPSKAELNKYLENLPDYEKIKQTELKHWQDKGLIKLITEKNKNIVICDFEKINQLQLSDLLKDSKLFNSKYFGANNTFHAMYYLFNDGVISKDDYQNYKKNNLPVKSKPLYYIPQNKESAFDIDKIKQSDFYWDYWNKHRGIKTLPNLPDVDPKEAALACIIFHPKYGNGRINDKGELEIYNQNKNIYQPFSANYIKTTFSRLGQAGKEGDRIDDGIQFAQKHARNLIKKNILKLEDFKILSKENIPNDLIIKRQIKNGYFMIDRIRYYVGKGIKESYARKLNNTTGCIVDKNDNVSHIFTILKSENKNLKNRGSYLEADKNIIDINSIQEFSKKRPEESEEKYKSRIDPIEQIQFELDLTNSINNANGPIEFQLLDQDLRKSLVEKRNNLAKIGIKTIAQFTRDYGDSGLKTFLSLESNDEGSKVLKISEQFDRKTAQAIFTKYSELIKLTDKLDDYLKENFKDKKEYSDETIEQITENLLSKGKSLLAEIAENHSEYSKEKIFDLLNKCQLDIMLFAAIFKSSNATLSEMKNIEIDGVMQNSLKDSDKKMMTNIIHDNNANSVFGSKVVIPSFEKALNNRSNSFHLLRKDDKIIGFFRLEPKKDGLYFGSFNMNPLAQRSGLGEAFMKQILDIGASRNKIVANVEVDNPIANNYISKNGFVVTKILDNVENTGKNGFEIVRDDKQNNNYIGKDPNLSNELIIDKYKKYSPDKRVLLFSFDLSGDQNKMVDTLKEIINNDLYIITRYFYNKNNNKQYCLLEKRIVENKSQLTA